MLENVAPDAIHKKPEQENHPRRPHTARQTDIRIKTFSNGHSQCALPVCVCFHVNNNLFCADEFLMYGIMCTHA